MRSLTAVFAILAVTSTSAFASFVEPRQATNTPTACTSTCQPATSQLSACNVAPACMCGSGVSSAYYACAECAYTNGDDTLKSNMQGAWKSYVDACKAGGYTVSQGDTLTGSSSSSSSSSNSNSSGSSGGSNTNTNAATTAAVSSPTAKSAASRSTSLGLVGLGAVALSVVSLF